MPAFWVDWRESDAYIVELAAAAIGTQDLDAAWQDEKLYIRYKYQSVQAPLNFEPGEQDKTLFALNRALAADYEVRYVRASEGGDTLTFMVLDADTRKSLASAFGTQVGEAFARIDENSALFA